MRYRLVVTTDGRPELLERTLESFLARVSPRPSAVAVVDDSGDVWYRRYLADLLHDVFPPHELGGDGAYLVSHPTRQGFCETVSDGWELASQPGVEWVYWLEDDFLHLRNVDLLEIGNVLFHEPQVAQMALYRNPVSPEEKRAGGYLRLHRDAYARRGSGTVAWFETTRNWTTNPSLFRRAIADAAVWPLGDDGLVVSECEGKFGIDLRELRPETTFGIWGAGDPWVEHIGERVGSGY